MGGAPAKNRRRSICICQPSSSPGAIRCALGPPRTPVEAMQWSMEWRYEGAAGVNAAVSRTSLKVSCKSARESSTPPTHPARPTHAAPGEGWNVVAHKSASRWGQQGTRKQEAGENEGNPSALPPIRPPIPARPCRAPGPTASAATSARACSAVGRSRRARCAPAAGGTRRAPNGPLSPGAPSRRQTRRWRPRSKRGAASRRCRAPR